MIKPGYKKTTVGVIPEDWEIKDLKEIGKFHKGKGISKAQTIDEGIKAVRYGEIYTVHDFFIKKFYSFINEDVAKESFLLETGDLLFTGSGETLEDIGKSVAHLGNERAYAGGDIIILRPKRKIYDSKFLGFLTNNDFFKKQTFRLGQGNSVVHIYSSSLEATKLPIPPLSEQKAIADCLSTWDKAIEKQTQLIEAKKQFKKGWMQGFFSGQLTVKNGQIIKAKEGEDFTEDWEEVKFKNIFKQKKEKACKDGQNLEVLSVTKIGIVSQESYFNKAVASDDKTDYLIIKKYDFVLSGLNFWMGSYDILRNFDIGIISPAYKTYSVFSSFNIEFIYNLIKTDDFKKAMIASSVQGASIVRRNLDSDIMKNWLFKIPKIKLQFAIAQVLQSTDKEIELQEKKLVQLQLQKKGLMQVLLTGERRLVKE